MTQSFGASIQAQRNSGVVADGFVRYPLSSIIYNEELPGG
jgi:hypothetical protein